MDSQRYIQNLVNLPDAATEVFYKKGVLKNLLKFTGKHCVKVSFLIKLRASACNFIKKDSGTGIFLWILWNFQEHLFLKYTYWRLLLIFSDRFFREKDLKYSHKNVYFRCFTCSCMCLKLLSEICTWWKTIKILHFFCNVNKKCVCLTDVVMTFFEALQGKKILSLSLSVSVSLFLWVNYPYLEFFWSGFSHILTRKTPNTDTFHAVPRPVVSTK